MSRDRTGMPLKKRTELIMSDRIDDPDLREYFNRLNDSLNRQTQELIIKGIENTINAAALKEKNLFDRMVRIVNEIHIKGSENFRILLHLDRQRIKRVWKTESDPTMPDYAYIDDQITKQLKEKSHLIIPDTSRIHPLKFLPDKKYPKAIAAYHFLNLPEAEGYFWFSFNSACDFSVFDQETFSRIGENLEKICEFSIIQDGYQSRSGMYENLLGIISIPVLITDQENTLLYANPQAEKILTDQFVASLFDDKKLQEFKKSKKAIDKFESQILRRAFFIDCKKIVIQEGMIHYAFVLMDKEEEQRNQNYLRLVLEIIGHNFIKPLEKMKGYAKLLGMVGETNDKQAEYLNSIGTGFDELLIRISDLTDIHQRIQEKGLRIMECSSGDLIKQAIQLIQAEARQKRIEVDCRVHKEYQIKVDQSLFVLAVYNLLVYAIDQSHLGGMVSITEFFEDNEFALTISDYGKGISKIEIEELERNQFLKKGSKGLSIADTIAKFHHGSLKIKSELGRGSTYTIQIPFQTS